MHIIHAGPADAAEILWLQTLAFQPEAEKAGSFSIPPLRQTLAEIKAEMKTGLFLKAVDETGAITGSVRAQEKDGTVFIGKLMVHPHWQKKGLGTRLLAAIEAEYPGRRFTLFTAASSPQNLLFYEKAGYRRCREEKTPTGLILVYLEK